MLLVPGTRTSAAAADCGSMSGKINDWLFVVCVKFCFVSSIHQMLKFFISYLCRNKFLPLRQRLTKFDTLGLI
jgi:hypothetical protein